MKEWAILLAFASALAYAGAAALQESAVSDTGGDGVVSPRLITALLRPPRSNPGEGSLQQRRSKEEPEQHGQDHDHDRAADELTEG